jgi:hypothetical protein
MPQYEIKRINLLYNNLGDYKSRAAPPCGWQALAAYGNVFGVLFGGSFHESKAIYPNHHRQLVPDHRAGERIMDDREGLICYPYF